MNKQQHSSKHKNFHGLRDFYSMVKNISKRITKNDPAHNEEIVLQGVTRNFGGTAFEAAARALEASDFKFTNIKMVREVSPDVLIKENLSDFESRHSMIITDN